MSDGPGAPPPGLLDRLMSTQAMSACWSDQARLQGMLDVEAALAEAEAACGIIPAFAATDIGQSCRASLLDASALAEAAASAGNLAIPLVAQLTARVRAASPEAAAFVHWGATSQDVQDTGAMLQARRGADLLLAELDRLRAALRTLAETHAGTVMVGRTWLQQGAPITFGLKAAGWLSLVGQARAGLASAADAAATLQFGGAVGTLASLGDEAASRVAPELAALLRLALPPLPWHTDRARIASLGAALGIVAGAAGKIARDLALLSQTELAEAYEAPAAGRGGSSAMPHKRNPVSCAIALSAASQTPGLVATLMGAMVQEHERGLGGWHAEWETLPALFRLAAAGTAAMADAAARLVVDPDAMRRSLGRTGGLVMAEAVSMALAPMVGKSDAHHLVERASRAAASPSSGAVDDANRFRDALGADPEIARHLDAARLDALLAPENALGASRRFVAAALDADLAIPGAPAERPTTGA